MIILPAIIFAIFSYVYLDRVKHQDGKERRWKVLLAGASPLLLLLTLLSPVTGMLGALLPVLGLGAGILPTFLARNPVREGLKAGEIGKDLKVALRESKKLCKQTENKLKRNRKRIDRIEFNKSLPLFVKTVILDALTKMTKVQSESLQSSYLQLGEIERKLSGKRKDADFISVNEITLEDGTKRYEVGRDLTPDQLAEIKAQLFNKLEIDVNDPLVFGISSMSNNEIARRFTANSVPFLFDKKGADLQYVGTPLDDLKVSKKGKEITVGEYIADVNKNMSRHGLKSPKEAAANGYSGGLHLEPLGKTAVALSMDGVVLAYAVAGEDGRVRMQGSDGLRGDYNTRRMSSRLNESLKECESIQEWCEKAKEIVHSRANIESINRGTARKELYEDSVKTRERRRQGIINTPKLDSFKLRSGIKR